MFWNLTFYAIVVTLAVGIRLGTYIVYEGTQVVVTQFGRIIEPATTEPGIYFLVPFAQQANFLEKRIETWKGYVDYVPTRDRQYVAVETIAHWQITDPILYLETLGNRKLAESRLDSILIGAVKDQVSKHALVDTVRNSNRIINQSRENAAAVDAGVPQLDAMNKRLQNKTASTLETVTVGREHLTRKMYAAAESELAELGIDLLGIYIVRLNYEPEVEKRVYQRMRSERERIAELLMSFGRSERERVLGQINKDSNEILSPAIREAEQIKGEADQFALNTYIASFGKDPEFYKFWRSMQAYRKSLPEGTEVITSTDSSFYQLLFDGPEADGPLNIPLPAESTGASDTENQAPVDD